MRCSDGPTASRVQGRKRNQAAVSGPHGGSLSPGCLRVPGASAGALPGPPGRCCGAGAGSEPWFQADPPTATGGVTGLGPDRRLLRVARTRTGGSPGPPRDNGPQFYTSVAPGLGDLSGPPLRSGEGGSSRNGGLRLQPGRGWQRAARPAAALRGERAKGTRRDTPHEQQLWRHQPRPPRVPGSPCPSGSLRGRLPHTRALPAPPLWGPSQRHSSALPPRVPGGDQPWAPTLTGVSFRVSLSHSLPGGHCPNSQLKPIYLRLCVQSKPDSGSSF